MILKRKSRKKELTEHQILSMPSKEWEAYRKRMYVQNMTPEQKEKIYAKRRVNRPKLKTGKKAPVWFLELLKFPKGKHLARDIAEKLGISDRNLKIVLRKRGIEPAGTLRINDRDHAYYNASQFKQIPKEEIEEAKKKLEEK